MLFKPTIGDQYSGSFAGMTASRNKGGTYFRQRAMPINPNTAQQQAVKTAFTQAATRWRDTLTASQRDAWTAYALATPLINRIGEARIVPGLSMFERTNVPRLQNALGFIDDAPVISGLPTFNTIEATTLVASTDTWTVTFDNTDEWATDDGGVVFFYGSPTKAPSINYYKGPYRLAGTILGDATTPPTSPAAIVSAWPVSTGRKYFYAFRVQNADGRTSDLQYGSIIAIAI